jgi:hypothetical protein
MNFIKKKEKKNKFYKICSYGVSGCGKSRFSISGCKKGTIVVDIENGTSSGVNDDELLIIDSPEASDVKESLLYFQGLGDKLNETHPLIVVDSWTKYSQLLFKATGGDGKVYHELITTNHEAFMRLPTNIAVIFQDATLISENGFMQKGPACIGKSFTSSIPYEYDIVIHLTVNDGVYLKSDKPSGDVVAKNRIGHLMSKDINEYENATELLEDINKAK